MAKPPAPGRTRVNDPETMRRRVLDAAADVFQRTGYHSASMQDIMQAAGVTGGALHHHFPSKKALAVAVIRERVATAVQHTWIEPVVAAPTAAEGISRAFAQVSKGLDERGVVLGCPLGNLAIELSLADPDFRQAIQDIFEHWRKTIAQKLRVDRAAGILPKVDPEGFATFVVASYSGALALAKAGQVSDPLKACARQLAAVLHAQNGQAGRQVAKRS